jgi:hypothetical protein
VSMSYPACACVLVCVCVDVRVSGCVCASVRPRVCVPPPLGELPTQWKRWLELSSGLSPTSLSHAWGGVNPTGLPCPGSTLRTGSGEQQCVCPVCLCVCVCPCVRVFPCVRLFASTRPRVCSSLALGTLPMHYERTLRNGGGGWQRSASLSHVWGICVRMLSVCL